MCDVSYVYKHERIVFNRGGDIRKQYFMQFLSNKGRLI